MCDKGLRRGRITSKYVYKIYIFVYLYSWDALEERDIDLIVTNPPWNPKFLKRFLEWVKLIKIPCILLLKRYVDHRNYLNDIFGNVFTTIVRAN